MSIIKVMYTQTAHAYFINANSVLSPYCGGSFRCLLEVYLKFIWHHEKENMKSLMTTIYPGYKDTCPDDIVLPTNQHIKLHIEMINA